MCVLVVIKVRTVCIYLLHELHPLPLLLLPQPLPPLSLLETFTERVVVVKFHLQVTETDKNELTNY